MGKINILNDSGDAKATLEFNGSSDLNIDTETLDGFTGNVQGQIDSKVDKISSTDNAVARFNGTTGQLQGSGVTIDDTGTITAGRSATQGSVLLYNNYADTDKLNIFGSKYSSGSTIMSYGVRNDSTGWVSTYDNFVGNRGALTIDSSLEFLSANGNLGTTVGDNLNLETRFKIDSAGRVTMPYQPSFDVSCSTRSVSGIINFDTVYANVGSHYNTSNGRFTAPVNGSYYFYTSTIKNNSASVNRRYFRKNGGNVLNGRHLRLDSGQQYGDNGTLVGIIYLNAGDYVEVNHGEGTSYGSNEYDYFGGYLIG